MNSPLLRKRTLLACVGAGALIAFVMIFTHTGPGIKPLPQPSNPNNRNEVRRILLNRMADALGKYYYEHGSLPVKLSSTEAGICSSYGKNCDTVKLVDLNFLVADGALLNSIDSDPVGGYGRWNTGFTIALLSNNEIRLAAPRAEKGAKITVTKRLERAPGPPRASSTK